MLRYEPWNAMHIASLKRMWDREWGGLFPMRERLLEQNVQQDRNVLYGGTWLAVDGESGEVAGYVVAKCWQDEAGGLDFGRENGWLHTLLVDRSFRGRGIGSELLARAERALRERGVKQLMVGDDFHRRMTPGVPEPCEAAAAWLEKMGFVRQSVVFDLFKDDEDDQPELLPQPEGVSFRLLRPDEEEAFVAFMRRCFPGRWEYQTIQYFRLGGTGREFVVAEKGGEIIGFCRINDSRSPILAQNVYWAPLFERELGGIGPLGIDERFRGHGYGLAIVRAGRHFLQQRGIRQTVIDTTPYVDFYGKLGYRTWRSYARFRKQLATRPGTE